MVYTPGPYDGPHHYLQWGGKLPGDEEWSCGLRLAPASGITPANDPSTLTAVKNAVQTYHAAAQTYISGPAKLSFVKLNLIGADGHYVEETTQEVVVADVAGGGPVTQPHPNQVALAVSLTTGFSRGPAHRGRFYLPLPGFMVESTGLLDATNATGVRTTTLAFIAALNAVTPNWDVAVYSRKAGAATHRLVTGVQVGLVLDTQRRRRRSLLENYV